MLEVFQNNGAGNNLLFLLVPIISLVILWLTSIRSFFSIIIIGSLISAIYYFLLIILYTLYLPYLIKFGLCLIVCVVALVAVQVDKKDKSIYIK